MRMNCSWMIWTTSWMVVVWYLQPSCRRVKTQGYLSYSVCVWLADNEIRPRSFIASFLCNCFRNWMRTLITRRFREIRHRNNSLRGERYVPYSTMSPRVLHYRHPRPFCSPSLPIYLHNFKVIRIYPDVLLRYGKWVSPGSEVSVFLFLEGTIDCALEGMCGRLSLLIESVSWSNFSKQCLDIALVNDRGI